VVSRSDAFLLRADEGCVPEAHNAAGAEEGEQMIRQTINCDICAAEKQASSYWFVAYEQDGEIKLRGWEAPSTSRKNVKHLCGQKCVQRMMSNFTEAVMATGHGEKETAVEVPQPIAQVAHVASSAAARAERMHIDPELAAAVEAESWAGPVRSKESLWDMPHKLERESFLHAARSKSVQVERLQKMA
jgi:hypothetical protein